MEHTQTAATHEASKASVSAAPQHAAQQQVAELDPGPLFIRRLHATAGNRPAGRWLQTKLKVGSPNDEYEQEADRVADRIMRMADPAIGMSAAPSVIQRKCSQCEEEERSQATIQRKCTQCAL
ncbi:MAG TPA: hypothetical protein VNB54_02620, partial [Alphaproteobacteria bacterium]|nr:hypothetical protein [Alphaproteobacteria bacterium]